MNQYQPNGNQSYYQQYGPSSNYNGYAAGQPGAENIQPPQNVAGPPQHPSHPQHHSLNQAPAQPFSSPVDQNSSFGALNKTMETLSLGTADGAAYMQQPPIPGKQQISGHSLAQNLAGKPQFNQAPQQCLPDQNLSAYGEEAHDRRTQQSFPQDNRPPQHLPPQPAAPPAGQPPQTINKSYSSQFNGNNPQYYNANLPKPGVPPMNQPPPLPGQQPASPDGFSRPPAPPLSQPMPNRYPPNPQYASYPNQHTSQPPHQPPQQQFSYAQPPLSQPLNQPQMQPNQYGHPMQHPQMMNQPPPPPQQARQLNPDGIPSVIQVIQDDKEKFYNNDMTYYTCVPSDLPPNETSINDVNLGNRRALKVIDRGCSRPNHLRSSIYNVPVTEEMLKSTAIPFNIVIKPFDEFEVEKNENRIEVPISPSEIVRCNRCKAYISPFMRFTDGGRRFQCAMCHHISEVSNSYYAPLDHTEQRLDRFQRPELHLGSYEFRTNEEFYRNKVMASRRPHIVFAFELTMNSRPLIQLISANLADLIKNSLPHDQALNCPPPLVGFVTYNSKIQLYDVMNNSTAHIISDVASTFPSFTTFLIDPITHMDKIEEFLAKLPTLNSDAELETESILGPVVEAAFQTCNADSSNWFPNQEVKDKSKVLAVGKIYLFHCSLPTFGQDGTTPGRLKKRWTTVDEEAKRLLGTDKEKNILTPEPSKYYTKLGERCVTDYGSGVELFLFPPVNGSFLDVATISELTRLTGTGGIYKYFNDYSTRFLQDLRQSLVCTMAFDVLIKVRTSTGIRPVDYVGNFHARNVSDIEVASLSAGNSISVEFKYDDKLNENEFVIVQVATLYTAVSGDRRVRVHNLVLPVCTQLADVFRAANCDALMNHLFRSSVQSLRLGSKTIQDVKSQMIQRVVQILTAYRRHCASPASSPGQLILPETLKLLPVYITGAIKCDAIDGGFEMMPDDKAFAQARSLGANCSYSQVILYPSLLRLQYDENEKLEAVPLRSAFYRLNVPEGVAYVLENGFYLFLYLPANPEVLNQPKFIQNVFGVHSLNDIHPEKDLPHLDSDESTFVHALLDEIRKKRKMAMKVYIVRQNIDKNELIFKCFLYEDKKPLSSSVASGQNNFEAPSYVDLLCHLHKEIRALLQ